MSKNCIWLLALVVCCGGSSSWAEDAASALKQCRQACDNLETDATLERKDGTWRVTGITLKEEHPRDYHLQKLAVLKTLNCLEQSTVWPGRGRVTLEGMQQLRAFEHLRRLGLTLTVPKGGLAVICSLKELESLALGDCEGTQDDDIVYLKQLQNLRQLYLPRGVLTDSALAIIKSLRRLEHLNLSGAPLTDAGLAELESLENLRSLDLSRTQITDAGLSNLKKLGNLQALNLDETKVTDAGLAQLKALVNLRSLDIYTSYVTASGLCALKGLPRLEHLAIRGGADLSSWSGLRSVSMDFCAKGSRLPENLERLTLSQEMAQSMGIQRLPRKMRAVTLALWDTEGVVDLGWLNTLPQLRELCLEGRVDSAAKSLVGLKSLSALTLMDCPELLSDEGLRRIAELQQLESLEIASSWRVTDTGMAPMRYLKQLQSLKLAGIGGVGDAGLACLRDLKRLRQLSISFATQGVRQVDGIPAHVQALVDLEELSIRGATLTDEGLRKLADLKKLRRLDLTESQGFSDGGLAALMDALPNLELVKRSYSPSAKEQVPK